MSTQPDRESIGEAAATPESNPTAGQPMSATAGEHCGPQRSRTEPPPWWMTREPSRMDQAGLTPKDLVPVIGRLNRVYEILNRKRPLTLNMIWKLHEKLGIPAECLIQPPKMNIAA